MMELFLAIKLTYLLNEKSSSFELREILNEIVEGSSPNSGRCFFDVNVVLPKIE